ncbi:MAG: HAD family hydrolase, partial [Proteobacteria bacterium]|nr:HAD family hydrolase [Pseudomonadota bacterium]
MRRIAYLFDIDGTLLHARGSGRGAFDHVMHARHGIADASRGIAFGGMTDPKLVDLVYRAHFARDATLVEREAFLAAYLVELRARLARDGVETIAGVHAALGFLADRARLGVATGNVRAGADAKLAAAG